MATQIKSLLYDCSTQANFLAIAQAISDWMISIGWVQTNDPAPVQFSTLAITACAAAGGYGVYTYTLTSGRALAVNQSLYITGMTNAGNNGTFVITALGVGTFTVVNGSAVSESGSSGAVTTMANSPLNSLGYGSAAQNTPVSTHFGLWSGATTYVAGDIVYFQGATYMSTAGSNNNHAPPNTSWWTPYAYEIWKSNDGVVLPAIYAKFEYGVVNANGGLTNSQPGFSVTTGTGTAGNTFLNGITTTRFFWLGAQPNSFSATNGTGCGPTQQYFPCYFTGTTSRFAFRMFSLTGQYGGVNSPFYYFCGHIGVERLHDTTGDEQGAGYTMYGINYNHVLQQSVIFGVGSPTAENSAWGNVCTSITVSQNGLGMWGILLEPVIPFVGYPGNPLLGIMRGRASASSLNPGGNDFAEGQFLYVGMLGSLRQYMTCISYGESYYISTGSLYGCVLMRWE